MNFKIRQPMVVFLLFFLLVSWSSGNSSVTECRAGDYKIAIDIGHTPNRPGAISARGIPEYIFNKNVGTLLYKRLIQDKRFQGSFIINEEGDDISLPARAAIANGRKAALLIAIHHDSVYPKDLSYWLYQGKNMAYCDKFTGYSVFYSERNGNPFKSLMFATILGSEMLRTGFCPTLHHAEKFAGGDKDLIDRTRGIYKYNQLVVLKNTDMPAVLLECGIIKNRNDEVQISKFDYQRRVVDAVFNAIKKFFIKE